MFPNLFIFKCFQNFCEVLSGRFGLSKAFSEIEVGSLRQLMYTRLYEGWANMLVEGWIGVLNCLAYLGALKWPLTSEELVGKFVQFTSLVVLINTKIASFSGWRWEHKYFHFGVTASYSPLINFAYSFSLKKSFPQAKINFSSFKVKMEKKIE